jgi:predicted DNA-binding transcriptional regulator AlpA
MHDGRPVIDRAELVRRLGLGRSTAEAWYRDRERNGHPAPVLTVGRRLFFDEADLLARAHRRVEPGDRIARDGRTLVNRVEVGRLTGLSQPALHALYARRATSGHPEPAYRDGRRLYFDEAEVVAWDQARRAAKKAGLTEVDCGATPTSSSIGTPLPASSASPAPRSSTATAPATPATSRTLTPWTHCAGDAAPCGTLRTAGPVPGALGIHTSSGDDGAA